jgi:hypothetical protein
MAVIKRIASKGSVKKIINYVLSREKTDSKIISGKDLSSQNADIEIYATKALYSKKDGITYHHIIQSFKPNELAPEKAHRMGIELAQAQFKDHEVLIATHIDKEHVHNHLIINSVSFRDGRKLVSNKKTLRDIKHENDKICAREKLSIVERPHARNRYTMAEYKLAEKGLPIWKEQLRSAIDEAKNKSNNVVEFKEYLKDNFEIEVKIQNKNLSYLHPEKKKYCRGRKLGEAYSKEVIFKSFEKDKTPELVKNPKGPTSSIKAITNGIEKIANKIAKDIERENLRTQKVKRAKSIHKQKPREKSITRER